MRIGLSESNHKLSRYGSPSSPVPSAYQKTLLDHKNYTKFFKKYLERARIEIWPALFNNLRKSAVTDAHDWLPPHVCDSWFGHSETIFKEHYAQVTEDHFKTVQNRSSRVAQSVAQQASEMGEKSGTAKKEDFEQDTQSPLDAAGYGKASKAPENDGIDHWAMRDSNPRHPRCKRASGQSEVAEDKELTQSPSPVCTSVCTSNSKSDHICPSDDESDDPLEAIVAAVSQLPPEQLARLVERLVPQPE